MYHRTERRYDSINQEGTTLDLLLDQASAPISPRFAQAMFSKENSLMAHRNHRQTEDSLIAHSLVMAERHGTFDKDGIFLPPKFEAELKPEPKRECALLRVTLTMLTTNNFAAGSSTWGPDESTGLALFGGGFDPSNILK
jgi:hypothetical protein